MPEGDLVEWFGSLPPLTQIFFGLFVFFTAIPIATLIVFQLIESVRSLRPYRSEDSRKGDMKSKHEQDKYHG